MNLIGNILYDSVYHAAPILLCVLGGIFAYKANVLNIALEGIMLTGAFTSLLISYFTNSIAAGYVGAVIICLLVGLLFSFMTVTCKGNVIVVGLSVNMLVPAVAGFVLQFMESPNISLKWKDLADFKVTVPLLHDIPLLGKIISGHTPITYLAFLGIFIVWVVMYKTKFGIYVRVVGENEDAARNMGLNTNKYRYLAILLGAFCCSLAGINLAMERMALFTNNMTAGRGFIAIAAIYCGQGAPVASAMYAIVFGIARAMAVNMGLYAGPAAALFDVIPYVVMSIVLTIVSVLKYRNSHLRGITS